MSPFRELIRLFRARFFESDALAEGSGYETNVAQVLGMVAAPGLLISVMLLPGFIALSFRGGPAALWELRQLRLFYVAWSFAATGFATVFEWDMLFPERRDFLILTPFPVRVREVFAAKLASLGIFLAILAAAVNLVSVAMLLIFLLLYPQSYFAGLTRVILAQVTSCGAAAAFGFLSVAAFQGILINLTGPRLFRRISPWMQTIGMSAMVLSLAMFPFYAALLFIAPAHREWLWYFPPYWFTGVQELLVKSNDPLFPSLGRFGLKALGWAAALFCAAFTAGYARHYRRTLESEDTGGRPPRFQLFALLMRSAAGNSPEERAVFHFIGATLARSAKHRLFLATYVSVGISFGVVSMVTVRNGEIAISDEGIRAFPLLVTFFVISGLRAGFQFPAELASNWVFRIAESGWGRAARDAARKRVLVSGLLPTLLLFLPLEIARWGLPVALLHFVFQAFAGALLIEALFFTFDKVPFTCSYFPGKWNFALLAAAYLYGFTYYSFTLSDLEAALEQKPGGTVLCFGAAAVALACLWRRKSAERPVMFEAGDPEIQMLNLN